MDIYNISIAIEGYAKAYKNLEALQKTVASIPKGDQKTGCIGEYYSYRYLQHTNPNSLLAYGSHSEKGWDIEIKSSGLRVQVKTVSAYSKTRTISPIHKGWDILHILYLNTALKPEGFWVVKDTSIFGNKNELKSRKCKKPTNPNTGSKDIPFGTNLVKQLTEIIGT
ncbi:MAG: hypothetical protein COA75_14880 [Cellvibrionales bacterium]|nr:MAG: hypothetical protein COA75_14880 [Cellvibrionales bacterium]